MTFRWNINYMPDGKIAPLARLDIDTSNGIHSYACRLDLDREFASQVTHLSAEQLAEAMANLDVKLGPSPDIFIPPNPPDLSPKTYAEKRAWAYPPIGDQLDMIYKAVKAGDAGLTEFVAAIDAIKTKYPKE